MIQVRHMGHGIEAIASEQISSRSGAGGHTQPGGHSQPTNVHVEIVETLDNLPANDGTRDPGEFDIERLVGSSKIYVTT